MKENSIARKCKRVIHSTLVIIVISQILFPLMTYSQTVNVSGKITSSTVGVQNASVTFINENDTTKKYYATTDNEGNFNIGIITSVSPDINNIPSEFQLEQNYPNPFSSLRW